MNQSLLSDPIGYDFPAAVDFSLHPSVFLDDPNDRDDIASVCARFNGGASKLAGRFLAVGRGDGVVAVVELETRRPIIQLQGHVKAVVDVRWSRCSRFLLSASRDWNVIVWDLATGDRRDTVRFDAPLTSAVLHPRNSKIMVVTVQNQEEAMLVDLRSVQVGGGRWELDPSAGDVEANGEGSRRRRAVACIVRFNPRGDHVYVGTSLGSICVFDAASKELLHTERVAPNSTIRHMEFDRRGTSLVVNANDRVIRVYGLSDGGGFALLHKFQDLINRTPWSGCAFSNSGEYIVGGTGAGERASHNIYVWDRAVGALAKILEGPKDPMEDLEWHPNRPVIASISHHGTIHIWTTTVTERWAAYAPGFEELEENKLYFEREDEFDLEDEKIAVRRAADLQDAYVELHDAPPSTVAPSDAPDPFADVEPDGDDAPDFVPRVLDFDEAFGGELEHPESLAAASGPMGGGEAAPDVDEYAAAQFNGFVNSDGESDASLKAAAFGTRKKRKKGR